MNSLHFRLVPTLLLAIQAWMGTLWATTMLPASGNAPELQVVYEYVHATPGTSAKPERDLEIVRLGDRYFYTIRNQKMRVYDFRDLTVSDVRHEAKQDVFPLPALIDERDRAFTRELEMQRTLKEANLSGFNAEQELFQAESRFQLESGMMRVLPLVMEPNGTGGVRCLLNGRFVGSYTLSGKTPREKCRTMFEHYLLYCHRIHPQIRRNMMAEGALPAEMIYREGKGQIEDQVTCRLVSIEESSESLYPETLRRAALPYSTHPLRQALHWALHPESRPQPTPSPGAYRRQFQEHFDRQNYLDALLAGTEFYLQTGRSMEEELSRLDPFLTSDKQLAAFIAGLDTSNDTQALKSLKSLAEIPQKSVMNSHILKAMTANALGSLGKYQEAEENYLAALKQNPELAGVLKELGDLYVRSDRFPEAWKCYTTALHLAPDHPMLTHFLEREKNLFNRYPEHF